MLYLFFFDAAARRKQALFLSKLIREELYLADPTERTILVALAASLLLFLYFRTKNARRNVEDLLLPYCYARALISISSKKPFLRILLIYSILRIGGASKLRNLCIIYSLSFAARAFIEQLSSSTRRRAINSSLFFYRILLFDSSPYLLASSSK